MNILQEMKLERVRKLHIKLLELEKIYGSLEPSPYRWLQPTCRRLKGDRPWSAKILDHSFIANARVSRHSIGSTVLEAEGWTAVELCIHGRPQLSFNVRDDRFVLHRFVPGSWESWFGVDHGSDCVPVVPDLFEDKNDPRWQRFEASGLSKWPPQLDPTAADPTAPLV